MLQVYPCKFCNKVISTSTQLRVHLRTHTNERPYKCIFCDKAFKEKGKLARHKNNIHGKAKDSDPNTSLVSPYNQRSFRLPPNPEQQFLMPPVPEPQMCMPPPPEPQLPSPPVAPPIIEASLENTNQIIKVFYQQAEHGEPIMYFNM